MIISELPPNPFVGLRPFESDQGLLFFGRTEQTVALMKQLYGSRFLAVVGSSGCGKSSLIRAGLIPKLKAGFLAGERDKWLMATMKPGDAPLQNLAAAVLEVTGAETSPAAISELTNAVRTSGAAALITRLANAVENVGANVLLLVDQFEEIFRFVLQTDKQEDRDEAADFVSIMLALSQQSALPVFVVMTMRSDFLGDCDAFHGLPEALNRSHYLVPRLTRQQRQQAIEGPILLYGEKITPRLLDRILNDAGDRADQLPVMQHALMRTWERWSLTKVGPLDLEDYEAVGTIENALSLDADNAMEGMSAEDAKLTERLFQSLTDTDTQNRQTRRPANLSEVVAITGADREKILGIVERFKSDGRSFLSVYEDKVKGDYLIDISHESLIRQWERLRGWVSKEAESRTIYLRIADAAVRHKARQAGLWRNPDLQQALVWRERNRPNRAWAQRHHPKQYDEKTFDYAMTFLEISRKRKLVAGALISMFVILSLSGMAVFAKQRQEVVRQQQESALMLKEKTLISENAEARVEQERELSVQRLAQERELNNQREAQERALRAQSVEQEHRLAEERVSVERRLNEQRIKQAQESARKIAEARVEIAEAKRKEVEDALDQSRASEENARAALKKALYEKDERERIQVTAGQQVAELTAEVKELKKGERPVVISDPTTDAPPPVNTLEGQLRSEVRWRSLQDAFGSIEFLDKWDEKNVDIVEVPELKGLPLTGGKEPFSGRVKFYKPAIPQLLAAFKEIRERGLMDKLISWGGSYVPRTIRGSSTTISDHALGIAFDINSEFNYVGSKPAAAGTKGSVVELVPIFKKYGFSWDGDSTRRLDGMHFEVVRIVNVPQ